MPCISLDNNISNITVSAGNDGAPGTLGAVKINGVMLVNSGIAAPVGGAAELTFQNNTDLSWFQVGDVVQDGSWNQNKV